MGLGGTSGHGVRAGVLLTCCCRPPDTVLDFLGGNWRGKQRETGPCGLGDARPTACGVGLKNGASRPLLAAPSTRRWSPRTPQGPPSNRASKHMKQKLVELKRVKVGDFNNCLSNCRENLQPACVVDICVTAHILSKRPRTVHLR